MKPQGSRIGGERLDPQDIDPADGTCRHQRPSDAETLASVGRKQCHNCTGHGCFACLWVGSFKVRQPAA